MVLATDRYPCRYFILLKPKFVLYPGNQIMLGLLLSLISQLMVAARWLGQAAGPGQAASLCPGQAGPARSQADRVSGDRSGYTQTH